MWIASSDVLPAKSSTAAASVLHVADDSLAASAPTTTKAAPVAHNTDDETTVELKASLSTIDFKPALDLATTPPTTTVDVIPVLAAAAASEGTFDDEAIKEAAFATLAPTTERSLAITPVVSIDTIAVVPTSCSTECATEAVIASTTTTPLTWVSVSSQSPPMSVTSSVVSTELAPNNDDIEHEDSLDDGSINTAILTADVHNNTKASTATADTICGVVHDASCDGVVKVAATCSMKGSGEPMDANIGDTSVLINSSIRGVPSTMEESLLSDQVPAVPFIQSALIFAGHMIDTSLPSSWHREQVHCHTPWPPPYLYLSWCDSSKTRPIPWPSFDNLLEGVHLTEPRPPLQGTSREFSVVAVMHRFPDSQSWVTPLPICLHYKLDDREENVTSVQHNNREEQFISLVVSLNVAVNFLKKLCVESKEDTVSGLNSRGAYFFQLWNNPWVSFVFLGLTSEERYGLALLQWEIAWQLYGECFDFSIGWQLEGSEKSASHNLTIEEKKDLITWSLTNMYCCSTTTVYASNGIVDSELGCYYQVAMGMEVLDRKQLRWFHISVLTGYNTLVSEPVITEFQQLNLLCYNQASKICPIAMLELLVSASNLFSGGSWAAHKVHSSRKFTSNHLQEVTYSKAGHLNYPVLKCTPDDSHYGGEGKEHACEPLFLSSTCALAPMKKTLFEIWFTCVLPMCTIRIRVKSKRNGELIHWPANNSYGSGISAIKSLQDVNKLFSWVFMDLDGAANQQGKIQWDPGGSMFALCSSEERWTDTMHCYAHLAWSSLQIAGAFQILLVAWTVDGLEFSTGWGQAPFQGGEDIIRATFSDQVPVRHDYYIACANQILFDYDYYLNQANYDKICNDTIYYREDYHGDSSKTKEVHMPWDPGKSNFMYTPLKLRLGVKPNFKGGGMLGPSPAMTGTVGHHMGQAHLQELHTTNIQEGTAIWASRMDQERRRRHLLLPPRLSFSLPFHACSLLATKSMYP